MALRDHLTPKQDAFATAYVETGNATEAYRRAYHPKTMSAAAIEVEACRTVQHPKVTLRIAQLQAVHAERHNVTVDIITSELEAARQLAIDTRNPSAAVAASMGKAKLHGLLTERLEHAGKGGQPLVPTINLTIAKSHKQAERLP